MERKFVSYRLDGGTRSGRTDVSEATITPLSPHRPTR